MRRLPLSILLLLMLLLLVGQAVYADSALFPSNPGDVAEPSQRAVIGFDGQQQILVLATALKPTRGKTRALRVIPFPSQPAVKAARPEIFDHCVNLTRRHGLYYRFPGLRSRDASSPVQVLSQQQIGSHRVTVVHLRDPVEFSGWLQRYLGDERQLTEAESAMVRDYFARGFPYLVLDLVELKAGGREVEPLRYTFATDKIFYPLKTSNLVGGEGVVELFVFSPFDGLEKYLQSLVAHQPFVQVRLRSPEGLFVNSNRARLEADELENLDSGLGKMFPEGTVLRAFRYQGALDFKDDLWCRPQAHQPGLSKPFSKAPAHRAIFERDYKRLSSFSSILLLAPLEGVGSALEYAINVGDAAAIKIMATRLTPEELLLEEPMEMTSSLDLAVACGEVEVLEVLLQALRGHRRLELEWTLWAACDLGDLSMVEALIRAGADPRARSSSDGSALDRARERGHQDIVDFIEGR